MSSTIDRIDAIFSQYQITYEKINDSEIIFQHNSQQVKCICDSLQDCTFIIGDEIISCSLIDFLQKNNYNLSDELKNSSIESFSFNIYDNDYFIKILIDTSRLSEYKSNKWKINNKIPINILISVNSTNIDKIKKENIEEYIEIQVQQSNINLDQIKRLIMNNLRKFWDGNIISFIRNIQNFLNSHIDILNKFCSICAIELLNNTYIYSQTLCDNPVCMFHTTVNKDMKIFESKEVILLLVTTAIVTSKSIRKKIIYKPEPINELTNEKFSSELVFPCISTLLQETTELESSLTEEQLYFYESIIYNSKFYFVFLGTKKITHFKDCYQYSLKQLSAERNEYFIEQKRIHGSFYAFHGTPFENLYCILRCGLFNASNTNFQLHGSVHGAGIYLSTTLSYSMRYLSCSTVKPQNQTNYFFDANLSCMLICELINNPNNFKTTSNIIVYTSEKDVCTKFIMVSNNNFQKTDNSLISTDVSFIEEITRFQ